jgi:pimeloyl-ACP methyl ester carboxylesterase
MMNASDDHGRHYFVSAPDGLRLHVRAYGPHHTKSRPVVCLPGLSRTTDDFDSLAPALAERADQVRSLFAVDSRGRGRSAYDPNPANYNLATELADLLAILTALEVEPAVFIGTSRGGILTMLLAAIRPAAIAGVVLNDIGPVIETKGLLRIKSYLGRLPAPKSFEDGGEILRRLFGAQFPKLSDEQWILFAKRTFEEKDGSFSARYDPKLATALKGVDTTQAQPTLWHAFDALASVPVMVVRGANSDILSTETVEAMRKRRPDLTTLEVADQGHAPLLEEDQTIAEIKSFIDAC